MNKAVDLDLLRHQRALEEWLKDCNRRLSLKFPAIEFGSDHWLFRTLYNSKRSNWHFTIFFALFKTKDVSFCDV